MTAPFPDGFLWGTATAAYQIEGAATEGGRSPSIWDVYLREHGYRSDTGDIAADHLHRVDEDLDLIAKLGAPAYRFSVSWSRVMPDGRSRSQEGIDFYRRLVDGLREREITPALTMYHMDLPAHLEQDGGWASRNTVGRFADYADMLTDTLGDAVPLWMTVNELYYESWLGYCEGAFPPALRSSDHAVAALHHMLLAHGAGVEAVRRNAPSAQVGLVTGYAPVLAATEHPADVQVAAVVAEHTIDAVLDPVLVGSYPTGYATHPARRDALQQVLRDGDLTEISRPVDFIGLNYYFQRHVVASEREALPEVQLVVDPTSDWLRLTHLRDLGATEVQPRGTARTMVGHQSEPQGMERMLLDVTARYRDVSILITENGLPLPDYAGPDGEIRDIERIEYLTQHVEAMERAIAAGARVNGYFVWSLLDNLEWNIGFGHRLGLVYVDYATQTRTPKSSYHWYAQLVRANRLPSG